MEDEGKAIRSPWIRAAVVLGLVLAFVLQASWAAREDSVTVDEFGHVPVGLYLLRTGDRAMDPINPPLARLLLVLPLAGLDVPLDVAPTTSPYELGYRFEAANWDRYHELYVLVRCVPIAIGVAIALLVHAWATVLHGRTAGMVALFLAAFCPTLLANAHLATVDAAGALGHLVVAIATWRLVTRPTIVAAAGLGLALVLAVELKLSSLVLPAGAVVVVGLRAFRGGARGPSAPRWLALLAAAGAVALLALNAADGFAGTLRPLAEIADLRSAPLVRLRDALPGLRLPLPAPFVRSLDAAFWGDATTDPVFFLAGELSATPWRSYHLIAFALKTPLPLLAALAVALAGWLRAFRARADEDTVFVSIAVVFLANAFLNPLNLGVRHVLPALPFVDVAASRVLAGPLDRWAAGRRSAAAVLVIVALGWYAAGTWRIAPRFLEFFNEAAGGPSEGHRWLVDSNLDWGQDLVRLRRWMTEERVESVRLALFGRVNPAVYGIPFEPLERGAPGLAVVSPTFLVGRPYFHWRTPSEVVWARPHEFSWLAEETPIARVGSLFVYDLR